VTDINRANWDAWAAVHGQDGYYDTAALLAGADSLTEVEQAGVAAALGDLRHRSVLQVQCHLGFDAISMARRGARVTAVDFSPVALARAASLARDCGVSVEFVEADATALPGSLAGRFDLAYATMGILCWIADPDAWMRSVASTLRPSGRLLLIDGHPVARMFTNLDPVVIGFPYADDGPHHSDCAASYAGARVHTTNVQYAHGLGEVVTAALRAGLRLVRLTEHLDSPSYTGGEDQPGSDGRYRIRVNGYPLPMLYTLIAERPPG
jgi:SAM-dependent methyltransferase